MAGLAAKCREDATTPGAITDLVWGCAKLAFRAIDAGELRALVGALVGKDGATAAMLEDTLWALGELGGGGGGDGGDGGDGGELAESLPPLVDAVKGALAAVQPPKEEMAEADKDGTKEVGGGEPEEVEVKMQDDQNGAGDAADEGDGYPNAEK